MSDRDGNCSRWENAMVRVLGAGVEIQDGKSGKVAKAGGQVSLLSIKKKRPRALVPLNECTRSPGQDD